MQAYSEASVFAGSGEDVSMTNTGYVAFGGADVSVSRWFTAGVEAQFRTVPHAIGTAPVSRDFGETDLGGLAVRVLFGIRR